MDPFHIIVDLGSLELSHGAITGKIHLSNATSTFPEPGWNDFVVVILGWWLEATAGVLGGRKKDGVFQFMDGPYSVAVSSRSHANLVLTMQAGPRRRVVETWSCEAETVRREVIRSAQSVLDACTANGWMTSDIAKLKAGLDMLTKA